MTSVLNLDVDVVVAASMHIVQFLKQNPQASVVLVARDERAFQIVEASVLLCGKKYSNSTTALRKSMKLRWVSSLFSSLNSSPVFKDDVRLLKYVSSVICAYEHKLSLPPLDIQLEDDLRSPSIELVTVKFQNLPNLDRNGQRGCRLMLVITQRDLFMYTSLQHGPGLQWVSSPVGSMVVKGNQRTSVTLKGPFSVKIYNVPEDIKVSNPRTLVAELQLHSSVVVSANSGEHTHQYDYKIQRPDIVSCELAEVSSDFEMVLQFRPVNFFLDSKEDEHEVSVYVDDDSKQDLNADEDFARRLQQQLNEESEMEHLAQFLRESGLSDGVNPLVELSRRVRGLEPFNPLFHRRIVGRESRADRLALPSFNCAADSKLLEEACMVCRDQFQVGEQLRLLPCLHTFHQPCVDRWLESKLTCPVCNVRVDYPEEVLIDLESQSS
jgi:hypothetical protein